METERIRDDVSAGEQAIASTCSQVDQFIATLIERGIDVEWGSIKIHLCVGK